jgi:hypothetical protein
VDITEVVTNLTALGLTAGITFGAVIYFSGRVWKKFRG